MKQNDQQKLEAVQKFLSIAEDGSVATVKRVFAEAFTFYMAFEPTVYEAGTEKEAAERYISFNRLREALDELEKYEHALHNIKNGEGQRCTQ